MSADNKKFLESKHGHSCVQKGSEVLGFEAEALAIYDLMRFVKPPISTLCVGNAFGEAAMLLASGQKASCLIIHWHAISLHWNCPQGLCYFVKLRLPSEPV